VAHTVDLFVDLAFFFDERVGTRNVGFWLIIIIETDKVFDGVVGKETFEFAVKLGSQSFVWGKDNRWSLGCLDYFGDGECFTCTRGPQQNLVAITVGNPCNKFLDCGGLVTCWRELGLKDKRAPPFKFKSIADIARNCAHFGVGLVGVGIGHNRLAFTNTFDLFLGRFKGVKWLADRNSQ